MHDFRLINKIEKHDENSKLIKIIQQTIKLVCVMILNFLGRNPTINLHNLGIFSLTVGLLFW